MSDIIKVAVDPMSKRYATAVIFYDDQPQYIAGYFEKSIDGFGGRDQWRFTPGFELLSLKDVELFAEILRRLNASEIKFSIDPTDPSKEIENG